jgi:redox-sensitive bicupin YhaK (pirin superfamily)
MLNLRNASEHGAANHGWLKSFHTFSFADYRDPKVQGFSDLLVTNTHHLSYRGIGIIRSPSGCTCLSWNVRWQ